MNVNFLPLAVSLSLGAIAYPPFAVTTGAAVLTPTDSPLLAEAVTPAIATEPLLPALSAADIETLLGELELGIETWFGLAGVAKAPAPPEFSAQHQAYYREWGLVDFDIAPFLGFWHDSEAYPYSVGIFPTAVRGQVCVVEFKPEWSLDILNEVTGEYGKDVISEQILSVSLATVQDGQLRSSEVQTVGAAIALARYAVGEPYPVAFLALRDEQGNTRIVAAADLPRLPADLPDVATVTQIAQALLEQGCTATWPTSQEIH